MSLILDALRKSESERRRGLPPSLHAPFAAYALGCGCRSRSAGCRAGRQLGHAVAQPRRWRH